MILTAFGTEEIDSMDGVDIPTKIYKPDNQIGDSFSTNVEGLDGSGSVQRYHEAFLEENFIQKFHLTNRCGF